VKLPQAASRSLRLLTIGLLASCAKTPETPARYAGTEGILEIVSVLRLHIEDDTYRFPPARDFTGKNVYRASLNRLERLEEIYARKLASGYLLDVVLFAKARALERIREYDLAARHYQRVRGLDSPLVQPASIGGDVCTRILAASQLAPAATSTPEQALEIFGERRDALEQLLAEVEGTHYAHVLNEELERTDVARASAFAARAAMDARLDRLALEQFQALIANHPESRNRYRHLLDLGDLYAAFSRRYVREVAPPSLGFDPATFDEYAYNATRLYEAVSQQDGGIEKVEAIRKLEAFLAFQLRVHDEKLPR
jgi:tetratricopeptide (TPR) repeat protein